MKLLWVIFLCVACPLWAQTVRITNESGTYDFSVEVADTPRKAMRGLMFRKSLPQNAGMIFIEDVPRIWYMWMKNTYIPLDMVFFDQTGKITKIAAAKPLDLTTISSDTPVIGVVELNAGTTQLCHIKEGDYLSFEPK